MATNDSERWDVFISHASEDQAYVEALATALRHREISVWLDTLVVPWGSSLRETIDKGLKGSRFVIVVLSKAFLLKKKWTEYELNAAFSLETVQEKRILPLWHGITFADLSEYSAGLADRLARESNKHSFEEIGDELMSLLGRLPAKPVTAAKTPPKVLHARAFEPAVHSTDKAQVKAPADSPSSDHRHTDGPQLPVDLEPLPDTSTGEAHSVTARELSAGRPKGPTFFIIIGSVLVSFLVGAFYYSVKRRPTDAPQVTAEANVSVQSRQLPQTASAVHHLKPLAELQDPIALSYSAATEKLFAQSGSTSFYEYHFADNKLGERREIFLPDWIVTERAGFTAAFIGGIQRLFVDESKDQKYYLSSYDLWGRTLSNISHQVPLAGFAVDAATRTIYFSNIGHPSIYMVPLAGGTVKQLTTIPDSFQLGPVALDKGHSTVYTADRYGRLYGVSLVSNTYKLIFTNATPIVGFCFDTRYNTLSLAGRDGRITQIDANALKHSPMVFDSTLRAISSIGVGPNGSVFVGDSETNGIYYFSREGSPVEASTSK